MLRLSEGWVAVSGKRPAYAIDRMSKAWAARVANVAGIASNRIVNEIAVDSCDVLGIGAELDFVEEVKELHPELQIHPLSNFEVLVY